MDRWRNALQDVYHITIDGQTRAYFKGWVDYQIGWDLVKSFGIALSVYEEKFDELREALYTQAVNQMNEKGVLYEAIPDTVQLVRLLQKKEHIHTGLLTGNLEKVGWWKLKQSGISDLFRFGLFSDTVKDRQSIALQVFAKAKEFFGIDFKPKQITVIGDTIFDIRCGNAINANTIGFTSDVPDSRDVLMKEGATLVCDSLTEKKALDWFIL